MRRGIRLVCAGLLLWCWARGLPAAPEGELSAKPPVRWVNGLPVEGVLTGTNAVGLVFQSAVVPWKQLSAGTRFRYERNFREAQVAGRTNAPVPAALRPAASNTPPHAVRPVPR